MNFYLKIITIFWPRGMWDLSSLIWDWTHAPGVEAQSLNLYTAREVLLAPPVQFRKLYWNHSAALHAGKTKTDCANFMGENSEQKLGTQLYPPISHGEALIISTLACDCTWRQGLLRGNSLEQGLRVSPNSAWLVHF